MRKNVIFIGLDVHKNSIVIAACRDGGGEPTEIGRGPNELGWLLKRLKALAKNGESFVVCYEAGPTGFDLARKLRELEIECFVVAPDSVPTRGSERRRKTDRRDAIKLARGLRAGDLIYVSMPDEETEAMRDLERCRDDAKNSERRARHQLAKFLLRHGILYNAGKEWTRPHMTWIRQLKFNSPVLASVRDDYLRAVEEATARVGRLDGEILRHLENWSRRPLVVALQALHGVGLLSAVILAAEIADYAKFATAPQFMAFLGLVPSEDTSGDHRKLGSITRQGNEHVRRILTESAWCYMRQPRQGKEVRARRARVSNEVLQIALKAESRLWKKFSRLMARKKTANKVAIAIARELAGFVWAIARAESYLAIPE